MAADTVRVLGDQLHRGIASLTDAEPARTRILLIESAARIGAKRWHRQRLHQVLLAMRRFAAELRAAGASWSRWHTACACVWASSWTARSSPWRA